jgi:hypothetical protein
MPSGLEYRLLTVHYIHSERVHASVADISATLRRTGKSLTLATSLTPRWNLVPLLHLPTGHHPEITRLIS